MPREGGASSTFFAKAGSPAFAGDDSGGRCDRALSRKPEMHHVAVGDDVFLAFQPQLAGIARTGFAGILHVVVVGDRLGADEAALEVGVDHARGLRRLGAFRDRPGTRLLRPHREIRHEVQEVVAGANETIEAGFLQAQIGEEALALFRRQRRDLRLDLRRDVDAARAFLLREFLDLLRQLVAGRGRTFLDVTDVEHGRRCQQAELVEALLLLRLALDETRGLAIAQQHQRALDEVERLFGFLRVFALALRLLLEVVGPLLEAFEIREHQLRLDGLDVGDRIDAAFDMGDVVVLEAAHDVRDGIDLTNGREELVAEPFALRRALHQPRDVDERQPRRDDLGGAGKLRQRLKPRIGHRHLADVRLDGAERIVRRLRRRGLRQRVEQRRFADVRHADDAAFESHDASLLFLRCRLRLAVGLSEALRIHGEMHLVLKTRILATRQIVRVVGDDVRQCLHPAALALGKISEHVGVDLILHTRMTDPEAHAAIVVADMRRDRTQAVVPRDAAADLHPHLAGRQLKLVLEHHDVGELRQLVEVHRLRHRVAGLVHIGARHQQQNLLASQRAFGCDTLKTAAPRREAVALGNGLDGHEADVVPVVSILFAGISQPDEKQHGSHRSNVALLLRRGGLRSGGGSTGSRSSARSRSSTRSRSGTRGRSGGAFGGRSSSGGRGRSSGVARSALFFGVARRRHDGHERQVDVRGRLHAFRQLDVAQMLRVVDLELTDVDLDRKRNGFRLHDHRDGVGDDVDGAAALHARCLVGVDDVDRDAHADRRACAEAHEVHMDGIVTDGVELEVARDHAMLHAFDFDVEQRGEEAAGVNLLPDLRVIDRDGDRGLSIPVDHSRNSSSATLRTGGPLACLRARRRLNFSDGGHS